MYKITVVAKAHNKQMLIAHAAHGLRRENACAFSRAKFGCYASTAMSQDMPKYDVRVGEDSFGIFVEVADFNDYDELEDLFVEQYDLEVITVAHANNSENGNYKIWFNQALSVDFIKKIINEINIKSA